MAKRQRSGRPAARGDRRARTDGRAARVSRLLELNERLRDYLPAVTDRANALQVTRETVATWDRSHVERVRSANIERLERVLSVCDAVRGYLPTERLVGVWLKSPQTFLYGLAPLEYLHEDGEVDVLIASIPPPVATIGEERAAAYRRVRPRLDELVEPTRRRRRQADESQGEQPAQKQVTPRTRKSPLGAGAMSPSWIPKDMERLFSPGFRKSLEQAMRLSRQLDQPPLRQLLRQQQRQAEAIRRIYDFPQLERQIEQLTKLKVPVAMQQAVAAQAQFASLAERMPKAPEVRELAVISEAVTKATNALKVAEASALSRQLDHALSPAIASWRTIAEALPDQLSSVQLQELEVLGRGTLALTTTSALMLDERKLIEEVEQRAELTADAMRARLRARLGDLSPRLVERLDGAWDTLDRRGPDFASQSANSGVEFLDWLLRHTSRNEDVDAWLKEHNERGGDRDHRGRPTRRAKVRYSMGKRPLEAAVADTFAVAVTGVHRQLEQVKHADKSHAAETVAGLLLSIEALASFILIGRDGSS